MNRLFATFSLACLATAVAAAPAWAKKPPRPPRPPHHSDHIKARALSACDAMIDRATIREVKSDLCASTTRAAADARHHLDAEVKTWLAEEGVAPSWTAPAALVDRMIAGQITFEPVQVKELSVIRATLPAEFSAQTKRPILAVYHRQVGGRRLAILGGMLAFVLSLLAAFAGYVRADEATRGYYTGRLRLLAAAGVGAAGVVVYQILT